MGASSVLGGRDAGEQVGVFGELHRVLERQARRADPVAGDDQRGDLDDLTFAARRSPRLLLRAGDVAVGGGAVAATRRHHGEQGVLDREVSHAGSLRRGADARLTSG